MSEPWIAIQVAMMPKDTNRHGTIFGGVLLSYIDLAGAIAAQRELQRRGGNPRASFVTVAINRVEFSSDTNQARMDPRVGATRSASAAVRAKRTWPIAVPESRP